MRGSTRSGSLRAIFRSPHAYSLFQNIVPTYTGEECRDQGEKGRASTRLRLRTACVLCLASLPSRYFCVCWEIHAVRSGSSVIPRESVVATTTGMCTPVIVAFHKLSVLLMSRRKIREAPGHLVTREGGKLRQ